jgi:hypothetical protein
VIVEGLDASSKVLDGNAASIVDEFTPLGFRHFEKSRTETLKLAADVEQWAEHRGECRRA